MLYEKGLISVFQEFSRVHFGGGLGWGYHSMGFWDFPGIYYFPRILSLKSFGNSYLLHVKVVIAHRFTCGKRKIC